MAADHLVYHPCMQNLFLGDIGAWDVDDIKAILTTSAYAVSQANDDAYADVTNELATANGYTNGGQSLANTAVSLAAGTAKFDADDTTWTAAGGPLTARYSPMFNNTPATPTADPLMSYILLDNTPADVTATDGNDLTLQYAAAGIITMTTS